MFSGQRGGSVFVQDFSRGSITPKNSQKTNCNNESVLGTRHTKDHFDVIKHHNHKFKLKQYFINLKTPHLTNTISEHEQWTF